MGGFWVYVCSWRFSSSGCEQCECLCLDVCVCGACVSVRVPDVLQARESAVVRVCACTLGLRYCQANGVHSYFHKIIMTI